MASRRQDGPELDPFAAIGCDEVVPIGSGGSSIVYRARQRAFDRLVALKVLSQPLADARARRRFERELALAGRLTGHPNVVTVLSSGFFGDGRAYVQMEYCPGGSLADRLAANGPFPVRDVVSIGVKIAGVLELARQDGIVHRDVKPANVLVTRFGEPALADFGIAIVSGEMTGTTQALTPVHAAPEVLESREVGPAADQWSLGSTLHTLLAGRAPFASDDAESLLAGMLRILNDPVPPIPRGDVPESLRAVLERTMAKSAADRWAGPAELGRALQEVERREGWPVTVLPTEEVTEARYAPAGTEPQTGDVGPPGTGLDPRATYAPPAPSRGGEIWPTPAAPEGDTVQWRRAGAPTPTPPPAVDARPVPPAPPPAERPPPPPGPPGESTQLWSRSRAALPEISSGPTLDEPDRRRWWVIGGAAAAVVAAVVVVSVLVIGSHGSRPTTGSATTHTLPSQGVDVVPINPHITNETGVAVTLQWQDGTSGLTHVVQYTNEVTGQTANQFTTQTSATVSGLTPGVSYCFAVGSIVAGTGATFSPTKPCTAGANGSSSSSSTPPAGG